MEGGDHEIIQACRNGDASAWEALVKKYRHLVYSIPHRSGLGPEEANDVFQAVFLALLRSVDELRQDQTLIPWLITTARRESWKVSRKRSREVPALDESVEETHGDQPSPDQPLEQLERQVAVRSALDRLDSRCRGLLELLFYSDPPMSYANISRSAGIPVASIGPTRIRCLEKLRRELNRDGFF